MIFPADERGAELQPHVKSLVHAVEPILNPRQVLRSPLSDESLTDLLFRYKEMVTSMEVRFRRGLAVRELKADLDSLKLLSDALDLPAVTACYHDICKLLVDHITEACGRARESFERGDFVETRCNFNRIDGLDSMEQHLAVVCPELRAREYVSLMKEMNEAVLMCFAHVSDSDTPLESAKIGLDKLKGIDNVLRSLLDPKARDKYRCAVEAVENRFKGDYEKAMEMISTDQISLQLDSLLMNIQLMPHFQEHFQDAPYYLDCVQLLQTKLNAAFHFITQQLDLQIQVATAPEIKGRLAMLSAASQLDIRHVPDAQAQYSSCLHRFDSKCNSLFACVDLAMSNQTYPVVDDNLGQLLLLLQVQDNAELGQRYSNKVHDIQVRLESEVSSIRCMLGVEKPRDQDYSSAIAKAHKFAEALKHLSKYLTSTLSVQFENEKDHIVAEIGALHEHVFTCAAQSLGLGTEPESHEDPKELAKSLIQIEFMLSIPLDFDNRLWEHRDEFRARLLQSFSDKCEWCHDQTKRVDNIAVVDEIQERLTLLEMYSKEFIKLSGRGDTLSFFFSSGNPSPSRSEINAASFQSPAASSASQMSEARTVVRQARTAASTVSRGVSMVRGILNFAGVSVGSEPAQHFDACCDAVEGPLSDSSRSFESVCAIEDLTRLLEMTLAQSFDNLRSRARELEATCLLQQQALKFEEVKHLFSLLLSFGRLEMLTQETFTERYKSAVSNARNMLTNISDTFDSLIRVEEMEKALEAVKTVRSMLVLKDDVPPVEEVYRRLNTEFQQKTSNFNATLNELLESKNFQKMARLLRGHGQLEHAVPTARHEFDSAQQQLAEFFKVRYESGWSSIQSIVPTKRLADHKLSELREVIKDFTDAGSVFEIFGVHNQFTEWQDMLNRSLRSKVAGIVQHAETCTRNLDFRGYDGCVCHLESLQVVALVADEISKNITEMDISMQRRIEGLEVELIAAIEKTEPRIMDKIFNGLKRGIELNNIAGKKLDEECDRLQTVLEDHLKELFAAIQRSLDDYEIREAHKNLDKLRILLVSEAAKGTIYNGDRVSKFVSEMDEIKQEILTPRLLTEDPEKISRCLEGFKEVDSRCSRRRTV